LLRSPYRFHRFLTEVEDLLEQAEPERECHRLPQLRLLIRRLVLNSYWLQTQVPAPCPSTGVSVQMLYDEIGYPLTVQTVNFDPGIQSTIHNHGNWGVVAVLQGEEKNTFWRRVGDGKQGDRLEEVGEVTLLPGDIISFTPDAIHRVESSSTEPTITFNLYGETLHSRRFEFDPVTHTARNF